VCDPRIAAGLRQRGVDVTTAAEAGLLGVPDEGHLAYGWRQARVIVTHDADFLRLHARGSKHAGIVYCRMGAHTLGDVIRSVVLIWEVLEPEDMSSHVEHL
jgi:predicted nuclease of predicted toxin-antitoxin system